jgi:hypothetical protein
MLAWDCRHTLNRQLYVRLLPTAYRLLAKVARQTHRERVQHASPLHESSMKSSMQTGEARISIVW